MALPTVVINSSTGSDSAASGAGPGTALTGSLAATHTNTTVNITDAVALGGVALDGSAALWISTSSGLRWSGITNITGTSGAWVVTVATAYTGTASGQTWAIGGQRATMASSTQLFVDWRLGWIVDVQTGETISSTITLTGPTPSNSVQPPILTSTTFTTWGTQPLIQTTTSSLTMFKMGTTGLEIRNLSFKQTSGTPGTCFVALPGTGSCITWSNCIFDGFAIAIDGSSNVGDGLNKGIVESCEIKNCTNASAAVWLFTLAVGSEGHVHNCFFHNNIGALSTNNNGLHVTGCVFANNSGANAIGVGDGNSTFINNSVYNCSTLTTDQAVTIGGALLGITVVMNNIFWGNPGYAISGSASTQPTAAVIRNNAYGGNNGAGTGVDRHNFPVGPGDIVLTANPFVSGSDFGLNATAGGGAACKGVAATCPNASANAAGDLGAIPTGGGGGGGGIGRQPKLRTLGA